MPYTTYLFLNRGRWPATANIQKNGPYFWGLLTPFRSNVVNGDVTEGSQFTQLRKCESPNAADFYDCCKNQRPVLLCTIPMLSLPAWYRSRAVGAGGRRRAMHPPILTDKLTLSQLRGTDYTHQITTCPPTNFQTFLRSLKRPLFTRKDYVTHCKTALCFRLAKVDWYTI